LASARAGTNTLLIDADLRNPSIHRFLGLSNLVGLSEAIVGGTDGDLSSAQYREPNLRVVTGGSPPPNPTEILASRRMDQTLRRFSEEARIVVIDSPPFILADASVLASKVDGVVLVVRAGHTREAAARAMLQQLGRAGANVVGVVLNDSARGVGGHGGAYAPYAAPPPSAHGAGESKVPSIRQRLRDVLGTSPRETNAEDPAES
jgi:capsular exopolysaccharide synthesis family protein